MIDKNDSTSLSVLPSLNPQSMTATGSRSLALLLTRPSKAFASRLLAFVALLQREFEPRGGSCSRPARAQGAYRRRRAARLPAGDARGPRGRLDASRRPRRPARPPRRDHRPGRPQDDDQRAQLGRAASSWPTSRTRPRRPGRTSSRARSTCIDAVARDDSASTSPDGKTLPARRRRPRRCSSGPRGWHLAEKHVLVDGEPVSASLFDFGLYFFHNARALLERGTGPVLLPAEAREPPRGAALERRLRRSRRSALGIPRGTIKATVLIETHPRRVRDGRDPLRAARALGRAQLPAAGTTSSASSRSSATDPDFVLPDRAQVTMDACRSCAPTPSCSCRPATAAARTRWAAWRRHPDQARPRGRTSARSPRCAPTSSARSSDGHDGTWVAHPGPRAGRARGLRRAHRRPAEPARPRCARTSASTRRDLLDACPTGRDHRGRACATTSASASSTSRPGCAASGCVPLYNLMEDAATAEISRAQVWQWIHHGAQLDDGRTIDAELRRRADRRGDGRDRGRVGAERSRRPLRRARALRRARSPTSFAEFLTLPAYELLD